MMAWSTLPWLTYFVMVMLLAPWPWWGLLYQLGALTHWTLNDPTAGRVLRETVPELGEWRRW